MTGGFGGKRVCYPKLGFSWQMSWGDPETERTVTHWKTYGEIAVYEALALTCI